MREIKFRGKRADNSEWVYGDIVHHRCGTVSICEKPARYGYGAIEGYYRIVMPETVGQFTGLKDKNGTEIYEGDEVEYDELYTEFEMPDGTGYWEWQRTSDFVVYEGDGFSLESDNMPLCAVLDIIDHMEDQYPTEPDYESGTIVIGNIHTDLARYENTEGE